MATQRVTKVERHAGNASVFNLEVAEFHSYFVSVCQVLVHNQGKSLIGNSLAAESGRQAPPTRLPVNFWRKPGLLARAVEEAAFWRNRVLRPQRKHLSMSSHLQVRGLLSMRREM